MVRFSDASGKMVNTTMDASDMAPQAAVQYVYSPTMMVLGGREHELLIVIVNCIEELYRTGERVFSMKPFGLTRNLRHLPT